MVQFLYNFLFSVISTQHLFLLWFSFMIFLLTHQKNYINEKKQFIKNEILAMHVRKNIMILCSNT